MSLFLVAAVGFSSREASALDSPHLAATPQPWPHCGQAGQTALGEGSWYGGQSCSLPRHGSSPSPCPGPLPQLPVALHNHGTMPDPRYPQDEGSPQTGRGLFPAETWACRSSCGPALPGLVPMGNGREGAMPLCGGTAGSGVDGTTGSISTSPELALPSSSACSAWGRGSTSWTCCSPSQLSLGAKGNAEQGTWPHILTTSSHSAVPNWLPMP